jgi:hypothetical protein
MSGVLGAVALLAALVPGQEARACGGFFCNQPDSPFGPPPVAQTAENVLFAMDRGPNGQLHLEAHVQIFYTGPADKFSWVVPVDSMPTLDVGSNRIFAAIDGPTQPRFGVTWKEEGTCKVPPGPSPVSGPGGNFADAGASRGADAAAADGGSVQVTFRGDVGPYDATVLRSTDPTDPKGLKQWLRDNGYYLPPEGDRIIDQYVAESKFFVAIKLISGKGVNEIQPLVMRFDGPSPCVPLRLTAIAAIKDLRINLWVLADKRVVPENFFEIKVNQARIDWLGGGGNYQDLVKKAADEAGGNAFVTDYAGSPNVVSAQLSPGNYNLQRLAMVRTPPEAMNELIAQNVPRDAALLDILRKHIPEPEVLKAMGIDERTFYNQLAFYWQSYRTAFAPFSGTAFAADFDAKLVQPLVKAQALFGRFAKLTRLSTYISPDEMNLDPLFFTNDTLPDVMAQRTANAFLMCGNQQFTRCDAPIRLELPDGQKLYFKPRSPQPYCYGFSGANVDRAALDMLPALETAWQRDRSGDGAVRANNRPAIDGEVARHNAANRVQVPVGPVPGPGVMPMPGTPQPGWMGTPVRGSSGSGSGCALVGAGGGAGTLVFALIAGVAVLRRRRR